MATVGLSIPVKVWNLDDVWVDGDDVDSAGGDVHADDVGEDDVVDDHDDETIWNGPPACTTRGRKQIWFICILNWI